MFRMKTTQFLRKSKIAVIGKEVKIKLLPHRVCATLLTRLVLSNRLRGCGVINRYINEIEI